MTRTEVTYPIVELLLPELEEFLVYVWRRQLAASAGRVVQAADDEEMVDRRLAVGFADLVGFTRLTRRMEEEELGELVEAFETTAADLVAARGGRLIKTLGDEVLYTADDAGTAADIALRLVETLANDETMPELRVGMAFGTVTTRMGDVFGTTVNLASPADLHSAARRRPRRQRLRRGADPHRRGARLGGGGGERGGGREGGRGAADVPFRAPADVAAPGAGARCGRALAAHAPRRPAPSRRRVRPRTGRSPARTLRAPGPAPPCAWVRGSGAVSWVPGRWPAVRGCGVPRGRSGGGGYGRVVRWGRGPGRCRAGAGSGGGRCEASAAHGGGRRGQCGGGGGGRRPGLRGVGGGPAVQVESGTGLRRAGCADSRLRADPDQAEHACGQGGDRRRRSSALRGRGLRCRPRRTPGRLLSRPELLRYRCHGFPPRRAPWRAHAMRCCGRCAGRRPGCHSNGRTGGDFRASRDGAQLR